MVFVDHIPDIPNQAHDMCKIFDIQIQEILKTDKEINSNLAVLKNGVIVHTHKGTEDEVNGALFETYDLHTQAHPNQILRTIPRDIQLKIIRTARVLLSMISRTGHRPVVKPALKLNLKHKIEIIDSIDYSLITELGKKNEKFEDYVKVIAFQLGQTLSLMEAHNLYTKEDIAEKYPDLEPHLMRNSDADLSVLEYKNIYIKEVKTWYQSLDKFYEYNYRDHVDFEELIKETEPFLYYGKYGIGE